MTIIGALLMGAGVWVILGSPDLSGATVLGAVLYLLGLWIVQGVASRVARQYPRDSTDYAVDDIAAGMVDHHHG